MRLNNFNMYGRRGCMPVFNISFLIPSSPADLLYFRLFIAFMAYLSVILKSKAENDFDFSDIVSNFSKYLFWGPYFSSMLNNLEK